MNPRIQKVAAEIARVKEKLAAQQQRLRELEQQKTELELFQEFYEMQNNQPMSGQQHAYVRKLIQELKE